MTDINKGIVIRGISSAGAFTKDETDRDGRLIDASVNSMEGSTITNLQAVLDGMNQSNFRRGYAYTTADKIREKGGRVICDPMPGNDNHCQIFGLPLKDANNLFSKVIPW